MFYSEETQAESLTNTFYQYQQNVTLNMVAHMLRYHGSAMDYQFALVCTIVIPFICENVTAVVPFYQWLVSFLLPLFCPFVPNPCFGSSVVHQNRHCSVNYTPLKQAAWDVNQNNQNNQFYQNL